MEDTCDLVPHRTGHCMVLQCEVQATGGQIYSFKKFIAGFDVSDDAMLNRIDPDQIATIVYTSDTSGRPKMRHNIAFLGTCGLCHFIGIMINDQITK